MSNITVFSPNLVGGTGCDGPRGSYARIGWHTITRTAALTASSARDGWPASAVKNPTTYDRWSPTAFPAWLKFDALSAVDIDYVGLGSHTLRGADVKVQYSQDDVTWTDAITVQPSRDDALLAWWEPITARYWRILITGAADLSHLGVVHLGRILTMPRGLTGGRGVGVLQRSSDILPSRSDSGQFLGRTVIRRGHAPRYRWDNLPAQWYRDHFDPFVESALSFPFFIAANPARWPDDVLYAWTTDDIEPRYTGQRDWMSVDLPVEAL